MIQAAFNGLKPRFEASKEPVVLLDAAFQVGAPFFEALKRHDGSVMGKPEFVKASPAGQAVGQAVSAKRSGAGHSGAASTTGSAPLVSKLPAKTRISHALAAVKGGRRLPTSKGWAAFPSIGVAEAGDAEACAAAWGERGQGEK